MSDLSDIEPRIMYFDIEVGSEDGVPDAQTAQWPVTSIVAYDSYAERYVGWLLKDDVHPDTVPAEGTELDELRTFDDEGDLLTDFNRFVESVGPDILTGWFSNDFDLPYLLNRCKELDVYSYKDWSPLGDVYDGRFSPTVKGVNCVDMLEAYKKTQYRNLEAQSLEHVAQKELDTGKEDVAEGHTAMWRNSPVEFLRYNKVDVELVKRIDEEVGVIDLLDNLREVAGVSYTDPIGGNIDMMDVLFLRRAQQYGYVLPTAKEPETGWYYGAKVFEPTAGISENVCYMDVSSLYPSIIKQLNISPETMVGTKEDLEQSAVSEDDCVWGYIDNRSVDVKKESDPEPVRCYYRTDRDGFVASLVDELIDMKNEYRGEDMYAAVKRVTNSVYGVLSDSDSYSRGFRLFDWRMGESICLSGRKIITECADRTIEWCHENGYSNAHIKMGDTDGYGIALPSAEGKEEALRAGYKIEQHLNEELPEITAELFGTDPEENEIEMECESYASRVFVKGRDDGHSDVGVQKRYAQIMEWEQ